MEPLTSFITNQITNIPWLWKLQGYLSLGSTCPGWVISSCLILCYPNPTKFIRVLLDTFSLCINELNFSLVRLFIIFCLKIVTANITLLMVIFYKKDTKVVLSYIVLIMLLLDINYSVLTLSTFYSKQLSHPVRYKLGLLGGSWTSYIL